MKRLSFLPLLVLVATLAAQAQQGSLPVRDFRGVPFVAGGIGDEERAQIEAISRDFHLRLTFALAQGSFISDARVRIRDAAGRTVLETVVDGPLLLVNPPAGTYTVWAEVYGQAQEQSVTVSEDGQVRLAFFWRAAQ